MTLLGYDTVKASRAQWDLPDAPWQRKGEEETIRGRRRYAASRLNGVTILWDQLLINGGRGVADIPRSSLSVESSLPKLLWGHNAGDLHSAADIDQAVDRVNSTVSTFLGLKSPKVEDWMLNRVDVTADHVMPEEKLVNAVLSTLASLPLKRCLPVRGQSGSVSWPAKTGGYTRKVYSKYAESGIEGTQGRLRIEVGAIGQRAVRRAYPGGEKLPAVTVAHLVTDEAGVMRERVTRKMLKVVGLAEGSIDVNAWDAFQKVHGKYRSDTAVRMIGYAYMMQRFGGWDWLGDLLTRQGVYKVRKAFEAVGVDPLAIDFQEGPMGPAPALAEVAKSDDDLGELASDILDAEWPLQADDSERMAG